MDPTDVRKPQKDLLARLKKLSTSDLHKSLEPRSRELDELVERLARTFHIRDRKILRKVIDVAWRQYIDRGYISKMDRSGLLKRLRSVNAILAVDGNDERIVDLLTDRND